MKGLIRIGGALTLGIVIIFGALYMRDTTGTEASGQVVVIPAPTRNYIEAKDLNGNGIPDWEDDLQAKVFSTISTPSALAPDPDETYVAPETFTGKFSEAFFQDYFEGKIAGADFSDPTALVGKAVESIDKNTLSKRHTRLELIIVPASPDAVREYGNRVAGIMKTHSIQNENEAYILQKALTANDPKMLEGLVPIRAAYENMLTDTIRMEVPETFVQTHLDLLNAYEAILTDITAMQVAFTDPLYSLARVKGYQDDVTNLVIVFQNIAKILNENNVFYANEEPGAFFYLFEV